MPRAVRIICSAFLLCTLTVLAAQSFLAAVSGVLELRGVERNVAYGLVQVIEGRDLYRPTSVPPFAIIQYPPLFYWVTGGLARALRVHEAHHLLTVGRLVSICASALGLAAMATVLRRHLGLSWLVVLLSLVTSALWLTPWGILCRPDGLLTAGTTGLLLCLLIDARRHPERPGFGPILLGSLCASLALLSKQNGLVPIAITVAHFALERKWERLIVLATTTATIVMLVGLPLLVASGAAAWPSNNIGGLANGISLNRALTQCIRPSLTIGPLTLLAAAGFACRWPTLSGDATKRLLGRWLLALIVFSLATCLKIGSAEHYFIDVAIASSVCVAMVTDGLLRSEGACAPRNRRIGYLLLALLMLEASYHAYIKVSFLRRRLDTHTRHPWTRMVAPKDIRALDAAVASTLAPAVGRSWILTNDPWITLRYPTLTLLPTPDVSNCNLAAGTLSRELIMEVIRAGAVGCIVVREGSSNELPLGNAVMAPLFEPKGRIGPYEISVLRSR